MIKIDLQGEEKIIEAIERYPREMGAALGAAGKEAGEWLLDIEGLKRYPPSTAANSPPTPYYIRGRGMQYKSKNTLKSERLGTKWSITSRANGYSTQIGNNVSYAQYVHGDAQAGHMADKGWRKPKETAQENIGMIIDIYDRWMAYMIKKLGI